MATYYIDPAAADDTGTGAVGDPFKTVTKGITQINADAAAGILILVNSINHTLIDDGDTDIRVLQQTTIRNIDDDEDYTKAEITMSAGIRMTLRNDNLVTFKGITFKDTANTTNNTIIQITGSNVANLVFTGVKFSNLSSTSDSWGAICKITGSGGDVTFTNCVMDNCHHKGTSGSARRMVSIISANVIIDNLTMTNCGNKTNGWYGQIFIGNGRASFDQTTAVKNSSFTNIYNPGDGATMYLFSDAIATTDATHTATVEDCTFTDCGAGLKGGAFWFGRDTLGYCKRCDFTDCVGGSALGGAVGKGTSVVQTTNQYMEVESCKFIRCSSTAKGGAISCEDGSHAIIDNCTFVDCTSSNDADAIFIFDKDKTYSTTLSEIKNCIIVGAVANTYHIIGNGDDGLTLITNNVIQGGTGTISDTGATISGTVDKTEAQTLTFTQRLIADSPAKYIGTYTTIAKTDIRNRRMSNPPSAGCYTPSSGDPADARTFRS